MTNTIIWTIVILTVLGLLLALLLFWVAKKFKVEEDPRIDEVEAVMPGANCGGCGFAGCRAFADAAVKAPDLDNNYCPVGGNEVMKKVAAILGYEIKEKAQQVAVVRCNGTCDNRPLINVYDGAKSCRVKAGLYSGDTGCPFGCLGCGDCVAACRFGAISMDPATGLPVVDDSKCTACGACVKACPKGIIELRNKGPRSMRVFVSCVNKDKGGVARKACSAACIGCGKCAKVCASGAITVENNLAYIDFTKCKLCKKCVAECPTGAIHAVNFPVLKKRTADEVAAAKIKGNAATTSSAVASSSATAAPVAAGEAENRGNASPTATGAAPSAAAAQLPNGEAENRGDASPAATGAAPSTAAAQLPNGEAENRGDASPAATGFSPSAAAMTATAPVEQKKED